MSPPLLSAAEALARVLALMAPVGSESVPLAEASGRVLAAPVVARRDQPPFAASAMDGYAVRAAEAREGARLCLAGEVPAGGAAAAPLGPGEAIRIFTGAPLPEGADSVLIQEDAVREGEAVIVREAPAAGANVRPAGGDFRAGARIPAPRRLSTGDIALAASMNAPFLEVARRPLFALVATGDELVEPGDTPGPSQIVSSNAYGLAAMLEATGARARIDPIARDNAPALRAALDRAADADVIVTLGGASVGDHDLVAKVFAEEGLALSFYRVAIRPGKPLMAGRVRGKPMIGLPGNPVSALVLGHILLRPAVDALLGLDAGPLPRLRARLGQALGPNGPREHYMRARLEEDGRGPVVFPFPNQDSSLLSVLAAANALAVIPPGVGAMAPGEEIDVIRL
ncbi:MAG: gephyrin-like molybdotransferase Glp [Pikeienuella sp.]|uniref:molybdopterin molybdotransferase MoeA n=1 Tax=Pikeienuella sp. TaxID=2831957 RepID=UPI00391CB1C5